MDIVEMEIAAIASVSAIIGAAIGAVGAYWGALKSARINARHGTRSMVLNTAINAGIAEFRAALDANLQGKSSLIPPPLDYYIHCSIVHHFHLHRLEVPPFAEFENALVHTRSFRTEYERRFKDSWNPKRKGRPADITGCPTE